MAKIPSSKFPAGKRKIPPSKFPKAKRKIPSRPFGKQTAKIPSRKFATAKKPTSQDSKGTAVLGHPANE